MSDDRTPTADLVAMALKRNHEAFIVLVNRCRPLLYARAGRYTGGPIQAEDLLQETYLRAYRNLGELKDPKAFLPWILTILDRLSSREAARERQARGAERSDEAPRSQALAAEAARAFLEVGDWPGLRLDLREAMARLQGSDREILLLRFGAGLSASQIGTHLGRREGSVRVALHRAILNLRSLLGVRS